MSDDMNDRLLAAFTLNSEFHMHVDNESEDPAEGIFISIYDLAFNLGNIHRGLMEQQQHLDNPSDITYVGGVMAGVKAIHSIIIQVTRSTMYESVNEFAGENEDVKSVGYHLTDDFINALKTSSMPLDEGEEDQ